MIDNEMKTFVMENAINWSASDKPLDTNLKDNHHGYSSLSAGHPKHEFVFITTTLFIIIIIIRSNNE